MNPRSTRLQLYYEGVDISADLQSHLISWNYTDHLSGQADDLQISLEDVSQLWIGPWMPETGAILKAKIIQENRKYTGTKEELSLGLFDIDEIEFGGPPSTATIKATSVPESTSLRGQNKNRAWEKTKLSVVANDIAVTAKMQLFYDTDDNPEYDRVEQNEESDLVFLMRLCNDAGLALKLNGTQIIIFDEYKYEQQPPITRIMKGEGYIKSYQARTTLSGTYKACRVEYHDPNTNQTIKYTFTPPNPPKTERVLVVKERVSSVRDAERLAKKRLRQENKNGISFSMTLLGDIRFVAGVTINLVGFGAFDGIYIIFQATHSQQGAYETKIEMRKRLEGY